MAKNIKINDKNVRIQIWDTAGSEAYRSITRTYYKGSACAFIVYDITEKKTFYDVASWLQDCKDMCFKDILIYLVGNKNDLEDKRQVTQEEAQEFADENNLIFFETSALTGNNIEKIFNESATKLVNKIESGEIQENTANSGIKVVNYQKDSNEKKKKGCC